MAVLGLIAAIRSEIARDVAAARDRDPAAHGVGTLEILLAWPGVQAVLAYRVVNRLHRAGVPLLPRLIATFSRSLTGIEIHPAATIGTGLFIDHGMGVVIGETARIGRDVTSYQGVTLGGTGLEPDKRHPTLGDRVLIGSGAKLLGPIVLGDDVKVGANAVVLRDVPAGATVVGIPAKVVRTAESVGPREGSAGS